MLCYIKSQKPSRPYFVGSALANHVSPQADIINAKLSKSNLNLDAVPVTSAIPTKLYTYHPTAHTLDLCLQHAAFAASPSSIASAQSPHRSPCLPHPTSNHKHLRVNQVFLDDTPSQIRRGSRLTVRTTNRLALWRSARGEIQERGLGGHLVLGILGESRARCGGIRV